MPGFVDRMRRDPGLLCLLLALSVAAALYAPTLGRGLVNHDDPWLVRDNWIVKDVSLHSLHAVFFDTSRPTRAVLGAEYLPVRDLSIMLDTAIWGDGYGGFHATNLALYLLALALWFAALDAFGFERRVVGLAILLWAVHPSHAESVAWLSERKGLLALAFSGAAALAYARYRRGDRPSWIAVAMFCAIAAVWSKALGAFAIVSLAGLELVAPAPRTSWRRSLSGLAALAAVTGAAFIPVLVVASNMSVVTSDAAAPGDASWPAMVLGIHGFYVRLALLAAGNSVSYPIDTDGPSAVDIGLGAVALALALAAVAIPRVRRAIPVAVVAGAILWLAGWFPASRLVLPVRLVVAADRYLLFPTLGLALAIAAGVLAVRKRNVVVALAATLVVASGARTLVAQSAWLDSRSLWARAVESNPLDADAWSFYAESLIDAGAVDEALLVIDRGLAATSSASRLLLRRALLLARSGDRAAAREWMQRAATAGEPIAMANLAMMMAETGDLAGAVEWARKAVAVSPLYTHGYRTLGKLTFAAGSHAEALDAYTHALALEPSCQHRFGAARALAALGRVAEARSNFELCAGDPILADKVRLELGRLAPR